MEAPLADAASLRRRGRPGGLLLRGRSVLRSGTGAHFALSNGFCVCMIDSDPALTAATAAMAVTAAIGDGGDGSLGGGGTDGGGTDGGGTDGGGTDGGGTDGGGTDGGGTDGDAVPSGGKDGGTDGGGKDGGSGDDGGGDDDDDDAGTRASEPRATSLAGGDDARPRARRRSGAACRIQCTTTILDPGGWSDSLRSITGSSGDRTYTNRVRTSSRTGAAPGRSATASVTFTCSFTGCKACAIAKLNVPTFNGLISSTAAGSINDPSPGYDACSGQNSISDHRRQDVHRAGRREAGRRWSRPTRCRSPSSRRPDTPASTPRDGHAEEPEGRRDHAQHRRHPGRRGLQHVHADEEVDPERDGRRAHHPGDVQLAGDPAGRPADAQSQMISGTLAFSGSATTVHQHSRTTSRIRRPTSS